MGFKLFYCLYPGFEQVAIVGLLRHGDPKTLNSKASWPFMVLAPVWCVAVRLVRLPSVDRALRLTYS